MRCLIFLELRTSTIIKDSATLTLLWGGGNNMTRNGKSAEFRQQRRNFLQWSTVGLSSMLLGSRTAADTAAPKSAERGQPTKFQIACMTLPYAQFPLERALTGIQGAGYKYVAWGTTHQEAGKQVPVLSAAAPP